MAEYGTDYGMTPQGFVPKRAADIADHINANLSQIIDPETGERMFQNPSDDGILQQIVGVFTEGLSECWEAGYNGSVQFDPLKNSGAGQAGTVQLNAILAKPGAKTVIELTLSGRPGTEVPKGARVGSAFGKQSYATTDTVVLGDLAVVRDDRGRDIGVARVNAECTTKGEFEPEPGSVVQIQTPLPGWTAAVNTDLITPGSEPETEEQLRRRQQRSTSLTSYRQIDAIYAAVMNVPGVIFCRAYQNDRYYPHDRRGIPFKEVAVVAEGGDSRTIGQALFMRFPVGVIGYGSLEERFYDQQGVSYGICFSRPIEVPVVVEVDLAVIDKGDFPPNYAQLIKEEIMNYARYGGEKTEGGFPPGADVIISRLLTPINRVGGHKVLRVAVGLEGVGRPEQEDLPIPWNRVARFHPERIRVARPVDQPDEN